MLYKTVAKAASTAMPEMRKMGAPINSVALVALFLTLLSSSTTLVFGGFTGFGPAAGPSVIIVGAGMSGRPIEPYIIF